MSSVINYRNLIPVFTFVNRFVPYNQKPVDKFINSNETNNKPNDSELVNNVKLTLPDKYNGSVVITEKLIGPNTYNQQKILNLQLGFYRDNLFHEEIVNVTKSMFQYEISHKVLIEGKKKVSSVWKNDNFNSKNFDQNFNYYLTKYNYLNKIN